MPIFIDARVDTRVERILPSTGEDGVDWQNEANVGQSQIT